jgi:thioredoxin 1
MSDATQPQGAIHLTSDDFQATLDQAAKDGKAVMVDFYADWCGPCQIAAPIIDKLAEEYADTVIVAKLDVDVHNDISAKYGVMSIPTVIMFNKEGDEMGEVDRKIGFGGEEGYREMLDRVAA